MSKKKKVIISLEARRTQKENFRIINELTEIIRKHPELRFHQILQNYKIVEVGIDKFYEESLNTFYKLITDKTLDNYDKRRAERKIQKL